MSTNEPRDENFARAGSSTPLTVEAVQGVLNGVIDPELKVSITELGMVSELLISDLGVVTVEIALTTAACPLRYQIKREVESKIEGLPGVSEVIVKYGEMTAEQKTNAMERARFQARENAAPTEVSATTRVLAIASGKGGVGKSSVTVNLAYALAARGLKVGVLDADIWGFSIPRMLGIRASAIPFAQETTQGNAVVITSTPPSISTSVTELLP